MRLTRMPTLYSPMSRMHVELRDALIDVFLQLAEHDRIHFGMNSTEFGPNTSGSSTNCITTC
jgi:hypothetical protein